MTPRRGDPDGPTAELEADLGRLVRRLMGLSPSAWPSRRSAVTDLLNEMERTTARLEGRPPKTLPAVPDHVLADAVAVVGGDAVGAAGRERDESMAEVRRFIKRLLEAT
jgi:hypothetical protein